MEKQYYRTFIGVPVQPPPGLLSIRDELMSALSGERISWVKPELFHVTLRFLGDTPVKKIGEIRRRLGEETHLPDPTELVLEGLRSFGPAKKPRVIWTGFKDGVLFPALRQQVDRVLEQCGIPAEENPFRAHLTLGRVRGLKKLNTFYANLERLSPGLREPVFLDRMVFYRSELGQGGPRYSILDEYLFGKLP